LKQGQPVSFIGQPSGEKVTGSFHKKVVRGGRHYAHVEMKDGGSVQVPVHHILDEEAEAVDEDILDIEAIVEGYKVGDHVNLTNPKAYPRWKIVGKTDTHYQIDKGQGKVDSFPKKRIADVNKQAWELAKAKGTVEARKHATKTGQKMPKSVNEEEDNAIAESVAEGAGDSPKAKHDRHKTLSQQAMDKGDVACKAGNAVAAGHHYRCAMCHSAAATHYLLDDPKTAAVRADEAVEHAEKAAKA